MAALATDPRAAPVMRPSRRERLVEHLEAVTAFVRKRVGDGELAADIVQDAFLRALAKADDLRDDERLPAWFGRILRNTMVDALARRGRTRHRRSDLPAEELVAPEPDLRAVCACLRRVIDGLPAAQASVLRAVDLGRESAARVAARLGITTGNLKVRRHRARARLKAELLATCRVCAEHGCVDCDCAERE